MAIAVSLKGLDGIMVAVNKTIAEAEAGTIKALDKFQSNVVADAKRAAPANEGNLRNSISGSVTGTQAKVVATSNYAAYLEFGTRKFAAKYVATLPADWQTYAATFKGKGGGTFEQFIEDIMKWVKAKGIGGFQTKSGNVSKSKDSQAAQKQAAYTIALHILRNGIRPQPFLYPAVTKHTPVLITDIKKVFE
jgi:HK97 gp10 family phage protein